MQKPKGVTLAVLCVGLAGTRAWKALLEGESRTIQPLSAPGRKKEAFLIVKKDCFVEINLLILVGRADTEVSGTQAAVLP